MSEYTYQPGQARTVAGQAETYQQIEGAGLFAARSAIGDTSQVAACCSFCAQLEDGRTVSGVIIGICLSDAPEPVLDAVEALKEVISRYE